jgi:AraC family transcriptional regulator
LAKIAAELERALAKRALNGSVGIALPRTLACGGQWQVSDVVCTSGPHDRSFEEQHTAMSIAIVGAGSFQYRCGIGRELMTPGSLLLGNCGEYFECGHEHACGDRCIAFTYDPGFFEELATDVGSGAKPTFRVPKLPALRELAPHIARACANLTAGDSAAWEELAIVLAVDAIRLTNGTADKVANPPASAVARVTRTVRFIERNLYAKLDLPILAREARLSLYHFLRIFEQLSGLTPHQYILRSRLRFAAQHLVNESSKVVDIALECGFGDVSNFNRAFRTEFGMAPRVYRRCACHNTATAVAKAAGRAQVLH